MAATRHAVVGREEELAVMRAFLEGPAPAALLLEGEAGIGKTSLWRAGIAAAERDRVLVARPTSVEAELSFAALGDLLGDVLDEVLPVLPTPRRRGLEAALLLVETDGKPPDRRTIAFALLSALRALASRRPVLVAVDDVQWLDAGSRSALVFCVRRLRDEPVRLLLTARVGGGDEQLAEVAVAIGEERLQRLRVGSLSLGAVRTLLQARLEASFQRPVLGRLYEASGGNPFFALELGRELARGEVMLRAGEPLPVPSSLRQLLEGRVARLSAPARRLLLALAAAGKTHASTLTGVEGVDEAVAADVLMREGAELRFSHPLLRSTVYELAPVSERRLVHRRLAESAADVEERARHLAASVEAPDAAVATALDEAAQAAFARGAVDSAAALGEQALRFTPDGELNALADRQLAAAGYLAHAGSRLRACELIDAARAAVPPGPDRARIALGLAWWGLADNRMRIAALEEAVRDARGDARLLAQVHTLLGSVLHPEIDVVAAEHHAVLALELAEQVGDPAILVLALTLAEHIDFDAGRGADLARIERALALDAVAANPWGEISSARFWRGQQLLATGELDAARSTFELLAAEGRDRGDSGYADVLVWSAVVEARAGNWERAQQLADDALEIVRDADAVEEAWCHWPLVLVAAHRGDAVTARVASADGIRLAERNGLLLVRAHILAALGLLELSLANHQIAHAHLGETARLVARMRLGEPGLVPFVPDFVEALVAIGDIEAAEDATAELEEQGRRLARPVARAGAARGRGLVAAARGDLVTAVETLQAARDEAASIGQPFELARTLLALGVVQRRARQKRRARETLQDAQRLFDDLGAKVWADKAQAELARIGGRVASSDQLTASERRIAGLVAEGKTNKEVAAALVVAERTVESALTQVYRKLDVRSRTELARKLAGPV